MADFIKLETTPSARKSQVVQGENYRFTVLTPCLLRLEYEKDGKFEEKATQRVLNRDFGEVPFQVEKRGGELHILTERLHLTYTGQEFAPHSLNIRLLGNMTAFLNVWYYGKEVPHYGDDVVNLKGTTRTLDGRDGECPLEDGLMSKGGISLLDDSDSLVFGEDGWLQPRTGGGIDLYFFGYGRDYKQCLQDFYRLCGSTPMLPRYALGNWWSRFYPYTEESYLELMERFEKERIPFSVAVFDMDWHITDGGGDGGGWTGYTWNRSLFPDPPSFLRKLHEKGMKVTLNVHPDGGIRAHEERYREMAAAMGIDPETKAPVEFDVTNPDFWDGYFRIVHRPLEEQGVDFWWIDWQSGDTSKGKGMDPLWMLNHYHYLDNCKNGNRGLCLSRYAGPGSHRYPIGFSGDAVISWETLKFQPYFTATAANIGYTWWSHDIGGHMGGYLDHELAVRWVQFGVFSPINRLHSSDNPFVSKEPWNYPPDKAEIMKRFLRLRHRMLPYLFTMNELCHTQGLPLVEPVYYEYPWEEGAYQFRNEYFFGTQLLVCPITEHTKYETLRAGTKGWLPEGLWFDFFTGQIYHGGRSLTFSRRLDGIPVLAKAGAVIPMDGEKDSLGWENPKTLEVWIYPGADNRFTLYEEYEGEAVKTEIALKWSRGLIRICGQNGRYEGMRRQFRFHFPGWETEGRPAVQADGGIISGQWLEEEGILFVKETGQIEIKELLIFWDKEQKIRRNDHKKAVFEFLREAQISFMQKERVLRLTEGYDGSFGSLAGLFELDLEPCVKEVLYELLDERIKF